MKKTLILTSIFLISACDSSYSVSDFKNDNNLRDKWMIKCQHLSNPSDAVIENCTNLSKALLSDFRDRRDTNLNDKSKKSDNWK
ncbi:EexN family lipoprotein [Providencia rettgeri]|uniref:EexN family lipoprotein n=1 Tax=Providencia TaxID=586 RepID=UPI00234AEBAB|nr:EexN family lipoprotein [Providencia sp. PROV120]ELR5293837.1 EexN family lipoprotein [Providencia stuartii]